MNKINYYIGLLILMAGTAFAVDRSRTGSVSDFTGDNVTFAKISVSSTTATALGAYSSGRGALTCINNNLTSSVYIGSSTAVTANGAASFPLPAGQSIEFRTNAGVFAIADVGITSSTIHCITEF